MYITKTRIYSHFQNTRKLRVADLSRAAIYFSYIVADEDEIRRGILLSPRERQLRLIQRNMRLETTYENAMSFLKYEEKVIKAVRRRIYAYFPDEVE